MICGSRKCRCPTLEPGDVLLRVDAALLCGTDVRIYEGRKQKNVTFPTVLGHEFAGTVVDANGPLPDGVAMGDQVAVYPLVTCGVCAACRKGHENICRNRKAFGYQLTGGLSQFVRVPAVAGRTWCRCPGSQPLRPPSSNRSRAPTTGRSLPACRGPRRH